MDIYWITDDEPTPESSDLTRHLGSLTMQEHRTLRRLWEEAEKNGIKLSFTEDSRLGSQDVLTLYSLCKNLDDQANRIYLEAHRPPRMTLYKGMLHMLSAAIEKQAGLVAFSD